MFEGDIELDEKANTILYNGDLKLTTDNVSYIRNIFNSAPGAWFFHPNFGFNLSSYLGQFVNSDIPTDIKNDIKNYFTQFCITTKVDILEIQTGIYDIFVDFIFPLENPTTLYIQMDTVGSQVNILKTNNNTNEPVIKTTSLNKYQKRII